MVTAAEAIALGAAAGAAAGETTAAPAKVNATNFFAADQGMPESIQAQKDALLELMAAHGEDAQKVWADAQQRAASRRSSAIQELASASQAYDARLGAYQALLEQSTAEAGAQTERRRAAEAVYKDLVAGDRALLERYAGEDIAAAGRGRGGGGGGGGRGGRGGSKGYTPGFAPGVLEEATLPADFFLQQLGPDPEGFNALNADQHLGGPGLRLGASASAQLNPGARGNLAGIGNSISNTIGRSLNSLARGMSGRPSAPRPAAPTRLAAASKLAKAPKVSASLTGAKGGRTTSVRSTRRMN